MRHQITLKNYIDYTLLPEDASIISKVSTLLGANESLVGSMSMKDVKELLLSLHNIDYDVIPAHLKLPVDYGSLSFGQWADIEHYGAQQDDDYAIAKELAVVFIKEDRTDELVQAKAEEILAMDIKTALPLALLHDKKKATSGNSTQHFIRKARAIKIQNNRLARIMYNKLKKRLDGMPLSQKLLLPFSILIVFSKWMLRKCSRMLLTLHKSTKPKN